MHFTGQIIVLYSAAVCSEKQYRSAVVELLFIGFVFSPSFVMQYLLSILALQGLAVLLKMPSYHRVSVSVLFP